LVVRIRGPLDASKVREAFRRAMPAMPLRVVRGAKAPSDAGTEYLVTLARDRRGLHLELRAAGSLHRARVTDRTSITRTLVGWIDRDHRR
jgi:hypothetical protein